MEITPEWMANLDDEDVTFIKNFLLVSGSLKEAAALYGVTYPTVRLRLDRLIQKIRLSEDAGRYLAKDGIFITSGIIDTREQDVLNALEQNGFQVIERRTSGGWVALACKAKVQ